MPADILAGMGRGQRKVSAIFLSREVNSWHGILMGMSSKNPPAPMPRPASVLPGLSEQRR